jgi:hypothetical protein
VPYSNCITTRLPISDGAKKTSILNTRINEQFLAPCLTYEYHCLATQLRSRSSPGKFPLFIPALSAQLAGHNQTCCFKFGADLFAPQVMCLGIADKTERQRLRSPVLRRQIK